MVCRETADVAQSRPTKDADYSGIRYDLLEKAAFTVTKETSKGSQCSLVLALGLFLGVSLVLLLACRTGPMPKEQSYKDYIAMIQKAKRSAATQKRDKEFLNWLDKVSKLESEVKPRLPGLIGIGVEKCGTWALTCALQAHPLLKSSSQQESHYFDRRYKLGIEGYLKVMPNITSYEIAMEKSPSYLIEKMSVPYRMKRDLPNAKVYVVLCDPVNRTISDFVQETSKGNIEKKADYKSILMGLINEFETRVGNVYGDLNDSTMSDLIFRGTERNYISHILTTGLYYYHLKRWFEVYNKSEILILNGEDILKRPWIPVEQMQRFLGIPVLVTKENFVKDPEAGFYHALPLVVSNATEGGKRIVTYGETACPPKRNKGRTRNGHWRDMATENTLKIIRTFYKDYNEMLYELIGKRFDWN